MKNLRLLSLALVALTAVVPVAQSHAQSCGASTHCVATSAGLIFFGRDDYRSAFNSGNFANTNAGGAFADFNALMTQMSNADLNNGLGVQTFDGFSTNTTLGSSQPISFGSWAGTAGAPFGAAGVSTPTGAIVDVGSNGVVTTRNQDPSPDNDRYSVSGSNYLFDQDDWKLTFTGGATAFGMFGEDVAEDGLDEALHIQVKSGNTLKQEFDIGDATSSADGSDRQSCTFYLFNHCWSYSTDEYDSGNLFFFAFVAKTGSTFDNVYFDDCSTQAHEGCSDNNSDIFAFDNLYASGVYTGHDDVLPSASAPEPASVTLLATGLAGLAGMSKRRRRKAGATTE